MGCHGVLGSNTGDGQEIARLAKRGSEPTIIGGPVC